MVQAPPTYINRDPKAIEAALIADFERSLGRTLFPAQPERLLVSALAYRLALHATQVQLAAELNLVNYSSGFVLEGLGVHHGVTRLPAAPARVTLRLSRTVASATATLLPVGTGAVGPDGSVWQTLVEVFVPEAIGGAVDVVAEALDPGPQLNGFAPGQIAQMNAPLAGIAVANVTASAGGAAVESDDALRERIRTAPASFSVAGSVEAYEWQARSVSPAIIAARAHSPRPGDIDVYVLTQDGLPSAELLAQVLAHLSDRRVRPMGDLVRVLAPVRHAFTVSAGLILTRDADAADSLARARSAVLDHCQALRAGLGADIVPNQFRRALMQSGVHDVTLEAPLGQSLAPFHWPDCTAVTVEIAGRADD
jgi:phage-related baseplate assembly protein